MTAPLESFQARAAELGVPSDPPTVVSSVEACVRPASLSGTQQRFVADRFHPMPLVVSARTPDAVILMDRRTERYHTLNEVGGRIWELLGEGATVSMIVDTLHREYDVPLSQLEADVVATLEELLARGLIGSGTAPQAAVTCAASASPATREQVGAMPKVHFKVPSVLRAGGIIAWLKLLLATRGFEGTLAWIRLRVGHLPADTATSIDAVKVAEYNVAMAAAFYPARAQCLERSLALYYLLRRQHVAVRYCQGARPYPFEAHAWIEYRSEIISDVPEHALMFAPLPEVLP